MHPADTLKEYGDKINLHDFDQLIPLICDDAVFWFNDGPFVGTDEIRAAFVRTWRNFPLETYWLEDVQWIAVGAEAACCIYAFHWKVVVNGKAVVGGGRGTNAFRQEQGGWKIAHEHLSQSPQP